MRRIREILTPENVFIEYELAGIGSRMIAFAVDTLIQLIAVLIIYIGIILAGAMDYTMNSLNSVIIAVGLILVFFVYFGYYVFFEMLMNGQTPGKKIAKIKVIKQNGEPIAFFESALRNILRLIDVLVSFCLLGTFLIIFTKDYKRVGDFAANTIVVKINNIEKLITADDLFAGAYLKNKEPDTANLYPVNEFEYGILKEFMERRYGLENRKKVFAFHLNRYFSKKFGVVENQYPNPYKFFEEILKMNSNI